MINKVLIVGLGSIGRRHIRTIKSLDEKICIGVLRQRSKSRDIGDVKGFVDEIFFSQREALDFKPEAVFVTNPAPFHVSTALAFAQRGCHLFIEKPLSITLQNIDELLAVCKKEKAVLMVGYVLRFFKPLLAIKKAIEQGKIGRILSLQASAGKYLPWWRPKSDYRQNVSARLELGGGVIFELSHELDYLRWLVGEISEVSAFADKISSLDINVEDVAEINLRFRNGSIGHIHLDMVDRAHNRWCRVSGTKGTLWWDASNGHVTKLFNEKFKNGINLLGPNSVDYQAMYKEEIKHFFNCIRLKRQPLINGQEGKRIVELALAVKRSARFKKAVQV